MSKPKSSHRVFSRAFKLGIVNRMLAGEKVRAFPSGRVVADLDRRLAQIDRAIEEAAKRGKTNTALSAMEGQRRARAGLASERNEAAATLFGPPSRRNAPPWPPKASKSRPRPRLSATWRNCSAPTPTARRLSGG